MSFPKIPVFNSLSMTHTIEDGSLRDFKVGGCAIHTIFLMRAGIGLR